MKSGQHAPYSRTSPAALAAAVVVSLVSSLVGAQSPATPKSLITPDKVETRIGTLDFKDGAPTVATAEKVRDTLDFTRALNVYNNSFRGASAYAIRQGFLSLGAEDNPSLFFPT